MIILNDKPVKDAVVEFAQQLLFELYHYDLEALGRLIDKSEEFFYSITKHRNWTTRWRDRS